MTFNISRRLVAEVLGTAILVATVVGSGIMADKLSADAAVSLLGNTISTGAILVVLITILGPISAHFNPVVTLVLAIKRDVTWSEASAYVVAVGYSVVLPFLPGLVGRAADAGDAAARARTVGGLVAAFSAAALMLSPAWGWLSDRWGRRPVLLLGMTGFAATLALSAWDDSLWRLYLYRGLNGAFSAAVTPVAFAFVADRSADDLDRARRFAWLNALVLAGYALGDRWELVESYVGVASKAVVVLVLAAAATWLTVRLRGRGAEPRPSLHPA